MARSLPKADVSIEYRPSQQDVEVISGPAKFHLRTLPLEDFPRLPEPDAGSALAVPAPAFVETVGRVARSASRDETRPHLTGVLVTPTAPTCGWWPRTPTGCRSRRPRWTRPWTGRSRPTSLRARSRSWRAWWCGDEDEQISVTALENQVVFSAGDVVLSSRLVDGRFPNYQQLLPESYEHELRIERERAARGGPPHQPAGSEERAAAPGLHGRRAGGLGADAGRGRGPESLPVPFKGEPLEIGFNPEFFRDGLESAETEELVLKLISPLRPGLIQSGDAGGFIYLVMPIRLNV